MINDILKASEVTDFDFRKNACPSDPMKGLFPKWVDYYKTKYAISKIINPSKILEIGVRYGYSVGAFLNASPKAYVLGIDNDSDTYGGRSGALEWARDCFSNYNFEIMVEDSQNLTVLPGGSYDLVHIDGQQDGGGTFHDLSLAVKQATWILVDGYFWTNDNFREANEFLIRYKDAIEFSIAIPGYAGELLIRVKDGFGSTFQNDESGSEALVDQYDASYYLQDCGGHESFNRNGPEASNDPRILSILSLVSLGRKGRLLDLGCGRGEVSLQAALNGFDCTGIDYSEDAISISREGQDRFPSLKDKLRYEVSNVAIYKPNEKYDVVVASDIIEHMTIDEVAQCYQMVSDSLSTEGIFVVHTFPNSWYYDYHYARMRRKVASLGGFLPSDPRSRFEKAMHINEQNPRVLLKQLEKSFQYVLLWFNSPDDPIGSLNGKNGHHRLSGYRDLYAIASNEPVDIAQVKDYLSFHLWRKKDIKQLSMEISHCIEDVSISEYFEVSVEIRNNTKHTLHSLPPNPVNLSYHWIDSVSKEAVVFDGLRTPLSFPICPGSIRSLQAKCQAPRKVGEYILRVTLVQEQHAWFDQAPFGKCVEKFVKVSQQ